MKPIFHKLWVFAGRIGFLVARYPISLIVRNSHRTRVLIVCGEDYLVLKHWLGDDSWMLPGGGRHRDEDPLAAIQRETQEEIGLLPAPEKFVHAGQFECRDGSFRFTYDLYVVRLAERPQLRLQTLEILSASWFDRHAVLPGKATPELAVALSHWP